MPGIVQDDGRVRVVSQEDGHEGRDQLMAQRVPGRTDLKQCQHQHVWAVLDGKAEELLHLVVLAHLRQPQQTLHQVKTLPVEGTKDQTHHHTMPSFFSTMEIIYHEFYRITEEPAWCT